MEKKTEFTQTAITLPVTLKQRMNSISETVNWSAVAREAFEKKLDQLAEARKDQTVSDIVNRLRASKRKIEAESVPDGFECGRNWATNIADYKQLANLGRWRDMAENVGTIEDWFVSMQRKGVAVNSPLAMLIEGDKKLDEKAIKCFWEVALGVSSGERGNKVFLTGFVNGALSVWESVKDQL